MSAITNIYAKDGFFWWVGVVEDRDDPLEVGRCRVRILGYHIDNKEVLPTSALPWAMPLMPMISASVSGVGYTPVGPVPGSWVMGFFLDGKDKQQPMMMGTIAGFVDSSTACSAKIEIAAQAPQNVLRDGSGNVVKDGSGDPIKTGTAEEAVPAPPPANQKLQDNFDKIIAECKARGITDPYILAAIVANVKKECGGVSKSENLNYKSNARIREVFGARANRYTDAELDVIKSDQAKFAEMVYGYNNDVGRQLGNTNPGDGYKYRGRGFIQLTGKANYAAASKAIFGDDRLVTNPDLVNDPEVAAKTSAYYFTKRLPIASKTTGISSTKPGNQSNADIVVTTAVAGGGTDIRNKGDIGREILAKVNKYSKDWTPGTAGGDRIAGQAANATPPSSAPPANKAQPDPVVTPPTQPLNDPSIGRPPAFADPSSVYPRCDYTGRPDTNKLATSDRPGTLLEKKAEKRVTGIEKANTSATWSEPDTAYCGKYPYNHVVESETGHVFEMDDTADHERIHVYHRAGTYVEIDENGSWAQHVQGDNREVYIRNNDIYIKGNWNLTVVGESRVLCKNTLDVEVHGKTTVNIKNDADVNISGNANVQVNENLKIRAQNIYMDADEDFNITVGSNFNIKTGKKTSLKTGTNLDIKADARVDIESGTNFNQKVGSNLNITTNGKTSVKSGGSVDVRAGGSINLDGSTIHLNDGIASPTEARSADPTAATPADLPDAADRLSPAIQSRPDLGRVDCTPGAEAKQLNDAGEVPERQQEAVKNKEITQEEVVQGNQKVAEGCKRSDENTPKIVAPMPYKKGEFDSYVETPYTIQLSKYFKLGDLAKCGTESSIDNAAFWKDTGRTSYAGLTKAQILDNMKGLCLNVLDPIKERYPNMRLTSALRFRDGSISQHNKGQAADMIFTGFSKAQFYDVALWIRDNVAYDQLLLEYKGSATWIHCSFNPNGNRPISSSYPKIATFVNDKPVKRFLCDLS